jgi:uncharacterized iron-regulated membrane protein
MFGVRRNSRVAVRVSKKRGDQKHGHLLNIQSYLTDAGGIPLVIDIAVDQPDGSGGYYLYTNQPTGDETQWWTIVDGPSGYVFIQSQWKDFPTVTTL